MRSERAKHESKERKIYEEGNVMRENSKEQDGKKAARKHLCGESRWGIATFHGEFIR